MGMESHEKEPSGNGVEDVKGCAICEHSSPQLEHELHAFAQLLFDIWLSKQNGATNPERDVSIDKKA
jgi:hypothetical protein